MAAQRTETRVRITIQQHRAVNTVLKDFRPRQRAIFGHVPDHDNRHSARFREARKISRRFTHLRHATGRRLNICHVHDLDGVNNHQLRLLFIGNLADLLNAGFRQHIQIGRRQAKTVRAHRHLLQRLFPGDVQRFHLFRESAQGL